MNERTAFLTPALALMAAASLHYQSEPRPGEGKKQHKGQFIKRSLSPESTGRSQSDSLKRLLSRARRRA